MSPDQWFALGRDVRLGVELELKALRTVLTSARAVPEKYVLAVNLSPRAVVDSEVQQLLKASRRRLIVELTEHEPAPELLSVDVEPLRQCGIRLAVDDAGSGCAGLATILRRRIMSFGQRIESRGRVRDVLRGSTG